MAKSSFSALLVLLVVISITETRTASLPKSITEAGLSIGDFDPGLQDRFRGAIQGGKKVVKEEGKICTIKDKDDGKIYKCKSEFTYGGITYRQCSNKGPQYESQHKSWCYYEKNGSHGHHWGYCIEKSCNTCSWKCYQCGVKTQNPVTYEPLCKKWCRNSDDKCTDNNGNGDEFGTNCTGC